MVDGAVFDQSVYCAGMFDGREAIVKLKDRGYVEDSLGSGLGTSAAGDGSGISFTWLNDNPERGGYLTSLKPLF